MPRKKTGNPAGRPLTGPPTEPTTTGDARQLGLVSTNQQEKAMQSSVQRIGPVPFPAFSGERVYMRGFTKRGGLPPDLVRWQPTVDAMLAGIDAPDMVYLMIDQGEVQPGASHRRPGVHIDGYWIPEIQAHGGRAGRWDTEGRWKHCDFSQPEALILAADVEASRAYVGEWVGQVGEGGDCSGIDVSGMTPIALQAGIAYAGNVTMLHESLPLRRHTLRTLVRLNVPGWPGC